MTVIATSAEQFGIPCAYANGDALDEHPVEFPRINESFIGRRHSISYAIGGQVIEDTVKFEPIIKHDSRTDVSIEQRLARGRVPSEAIFVAAAGATREDDGWVLSFVYESRRDASELVIPRCI